MEFMTFLTGLKWVLGIVSWVVIAVLVVIGAIYGIARLIDVIRIRFPWFLKE